MCVSLMAFPAFAGETQQTIAAINRGRGENEIIIYTPAFGTTTATNEWGAEAVVDGENKVVSVTKRKGNETIPTDGFIISGHGTMEAWIMNNIKVGQYCYYDVRSLTLLVTDTPTSGFGGMFYTTQKEVTNFNATRTEQALIVYTKSGTTGTNQWGYEVAVNSEGRIISAGGNNTKVPSGGFVISGHGSNSEWLTKNAKIGMKASYDTAKKTITLEMDAYAYICSIDIGIEQLQQKANEGKAQFKYYDYDFINQCLNQMRTLRNEYEKITDEAKMTEYLDKISALLYTGLSACSESRTVEYRGVWVRPTQKSKQEVSAYVQRLYEAGINTICVETLYDSTLICPAPEGSDFEQNPKFNYDVLQAYVEECHARGMELHVWMPIFYSSHTTCPNLERSVWYKNPSWRNINDSGKDTCVKDDDDFCFLNPAHPEVQEFLLGTYKYLLENYDIDGFELDYIRYQDGVKDDYGYDALTIGGFKQKYGVTPKFDESASYWDNWVQYRCDIITGFVGKVRALFNECGEDVLLCADVGEDSKTARTGIYQDYSTWISKGWIDLLKPMSYTLDAVKNTNKNVQKMNGKFLASGIGVFSDAYSGYDASTHVVISVEEGSDGVMFFEASTYLGKETPAHLVETGAFRNKAITPTLKTNEALAAVLDYSISRAKDIIVPMGGMSSAAFEKYKKDLEAIKGSISETKNDALIASVNEIASGLGNSAAAKALKGDLEYFTRIIQNANRTVVESDDIPDTGIESDAVSDYENSFEESIKEESRIEESKNEESKKEESRREESRREELLGNSSDEISEGNNSGSKVFLYIGIGAVVVIAAVVVVAVVAKKKK